MSKARNIANNGGRGATANRPASPLLGDTYFDTTIGGLIVYTANGWGVPFTYTPPSAPTGLSVDPVTAIATFTAPSNTGNSPITSYTVTSSPGGITASGASSGITVAGLTSGVTYTFTVTATNAYGTSAASSPSSAVTYSPYVLAGAFDALGSVTVGSGGLSSITFSAIPQTYTHLQIRWLAQSTLSAAEDSTNLRFNGDSGSNYSWHFLFGNGSTANASSGTSDTKIYPWAVPGSTFLTNAFGVNVIDILDYANTNKNKTTRNLAGYDNNSTNGRIALASGLWMSTAAVNSITLTNGASWAQNSQFALYGIR